MANIPFSDLSKKSKRGFFYLSFRSLILHVFQTCSVYLLARWLTPESYGIYGILNGYISVSWFFCDIGIAGALTQQKEDPTPDQLQSCAAVQLGLATFFMAAFWIAAPYISGHHHLGSSGIRMMRILACTIPVYAWRGIPRIFLDRGMKFSYSGTVDLIEGFATYATQILLAALGTGPWSFIGANVIRAVTGSALLTFTNQTFVWPRFHWKEIRPLLPFGISFQANAILPALRGLMVPLVLGSLVPISEVGLITWTLGLASIPMVLAGNLNQVLFVTLSKTKTSSKTKSSETDFVRLASRTYELALLGIAFLYGAGAAFGPDLIVGLFNVRWRGASGLFRIATLGTGLFTARYIGAAVLNASGRPQSRLKIELLALLLEYFAVLFAVRRWGAGGYFWAMALMNGILLMMTFFANRDFLRTETIKRFWITFVASVVPVGVIAVWFANTHFLVKIPLFLGGFFSINFALSPDTYHDFMWLCRHVKYPWNLIRKRAGE